MPPSQRPLSLAALWNMSFGFMGIQFAFGLQNSNMSAIYQYLGANESSLAILWLAAPLTGLIVQPIIGYTSDRTWTWLGRRRPYFMAGALLASAALVLMPHSSSLWMAAGLLWVLDASVNISMEPFRAFVGDLLPPAQRETGYAMQALLIGVGATLATALPWLLTRLGWEGAAESGSRIPPSVHRAFLIGAVAIVACVGYTVVTTREAPGAMPADDGAQTIFGGIWRGLRDMPLVMRRLAPVQFLTWLGLFCMWLYFTPSVASRYFSPVVGSAEYTRGVEWAGICNAVYNAVCIPASYLLIALARRGVGSRSLHRLGLVCAGLGLLSMGLWGSPRLLLVSMTGVGIGWAAILSMPYAQLANTIPPEKMGFYMGAFNFFIVLPQIVAATLLGPIVKYGFGGRGYPMLLVGGACMLVAALLLSAVPTAEPSGASEPGPEAARSLS